MALHLEVRFAVQVGSWPGSYEVLCIAIFMKILQVLTYWCLMGNWAALLQKATKFNPDLRLFDRLGHSCQRPGKASLREEEICCTAREGTGHGFTVQLAGIQLYISLG